MNTLLTGKNAIPLGLRVADRLMLSAMPTDTVADAFVVVGMDAMPIRSFIHSGAFEPEVVAAMSEALEAACKEQPNVARGTIANRILAAAKFGVRDPARLREAALRGPD
jgi:hypothetical protein